MRLPRWFLAALLGAVACSLGPANAAVYKCTTAKGGVLYQDAPCAVTAPMASANVPSTTAAAQEAVRMSADMEAVAMAKKDGCMACHAIDKKIIGPAFFEVAVRYKGQAGAVTALSFSISKGSRDKWGAVPMPPTTKVSISDVEWLAAWIVGTKPSVDIARSGTTERALPVPQPSSTASGTPTDQGQCYVKARNVALVYMANIRTAAEVGAMPDALQKQACEKFLSEAVTAPATCYVQCQAGFKAGLNEALDAVRDGKPFPSLR